MAVVEIRCPRCGSPSNLKNQKTHEYYCDHCKATFVFMDTTKREIVRDTKRHNCPICGRPVGADEAYVCTECGKEDLCEKCVDEDCYDKMVCVECIKENEDDCMICGRYGLYSCAVCGHRTCAKDGEKFDVKGDWRSKPEHTWYYHYFSLRCPKCRRMVCRGCFAEKGGFLSSKEYYCKKCGSRLERSIPLAEYHREISSDIR